MIKKAEKTDADDLKTPGSRSKKWPMPTDAGAPELLSKDGSSAPVVAARPNWQL